MHRKRPSRLPGFSYTGLQRYHLRFATRARQPAFADSDAAASVTTQILRACDDERFAALAYCVRPDHVHLIVQAASPNADLRRYARLAKQRSGFALSQSGRKNVWQTGYFERVLRDTEPTEVVVRYILNHPVRARLVMKVEDYPRSAAMFWPTY